MNRPASSGLRLVRAALLLGTLLLGLTGRDALAVEDVPLPSNPVAGVTAGDLIPFQGFHPEGWGAFPDAMGNLPSTHHSRMARKNINSCTACHEEDFCAGCHSWYPGAPRTHGPGWKDSDRRRRLERENPGLCASCHSGGPDDPINDP